MNSKTTSVNKYRFYLDIVSIVTLSVLLYIVSELIDIFPWGDANRDGLVLLIIPFIYVPVFIIVLLIDIFKMKLFSVELILKSRYFWIVATLLLFCILPNMVENKLLTVLLFLSTFILVGYFVLKFIHIYLLGD